MNYYLEAHIVLQLPKNFPSLYGYVFHYKILSLKPVMGLQILENGGYKVVSIWGVRVKINLARTPGLGNELNSQP